MKAKKPLRATKKMPADYQLTHSIDLVKNRDSLPKIFALGIGFAFINLIVLTGIIELMRGIPWAWYIKQNPIAILALTPVFIVLGGLFFTLFNISFRGGLLFYFTGEVPTLIFDEKSFTDYFVTGWFMSKQASLWVGGITFSIPLLVGILILFVIPIWLTLPVILALVGYIFFSISQILLTIYVFLLPNEVVIQHDKLSLFVYFPIKQETSIDLPEYKEKKKLLNLAEYVIDDPSIFKKNKTLF